MAATTIGSTTTITGTVSGPANSTLRVELFSNPAADPSGYGQGAVFLGYVTVATGVDGGGTFTFTTSTPVTTPIAASLPSVTVTVQVLVSGLMTFRNAPRAVPGPLGMPRPNSVSGSLTLSPLPKTSKRSSKSWDRSSGWPRRPRVPARCPSIGRSSPPRCQTGGYHEASWSSPPRDRSGAPIPKTPSIFRGYDCLDTAIMLWNQAVRRYTPDLVLLSRFRVLGINGTESSPLRSIDPQYPTLLGRRWRRRDDYRLNAAGW